MLLKYKYQFHLTTKNMGSGQSSVIRLPQMSKEHWQQIPIPSSIRHKSSHGQYKLYTNVLTNQRIEQYNIIFQKTEEQEQYVQSFKWREREDNIVNTKYLQIATENSFCGTRIYAKVYIDHTPYRLSTISDIPIPQNLYLLSSVLNGFQKLYELIGYFKPNEDMIGIDREGRVKVWLNSNFSKNYLYGPHYVEGIIHGSDQPTLEDQCKMVRQAIELVEENTFYQLNLPKFTTFIESSKVKLTFYNAKQLLIDYSKRFDLSIPTYFASLLHLLQQSQLSEPSQPSQRSQSFTNNPFKVSQSNIQSHSNIIHYIDPQLNSNPKIEQELKSLTKIEQQIIELQRQNDTTNETMFKNRSKSNMRKHKRQEYKKSSPQVQVRFQYVSPQILPQSIARSPNQQQSVPQICLPLSKICQNELLESARNTKRLTYSGIHEDYELDDELAEDLLKYFNN